VAIDYSLAKTWGTSSQFSKIIAVLVHLDRKSFDPKRVAAAVCAVVNVKGHDLESAQRLSVVAEQPGMKTDMRIGGSQGWKRQPATQEHERGSIPEVFHRFPDHARAL
jgi:hypothetical protein